MKSKYVMVSCLGTSLIPVALALGLASCGHPDDNVTKKEAQAEVQPEGKSEIELLSSDLQTEAMVGEIVSLTQATEWTFSMPQAGILAHGVVTKMFNSHIKSHIKYEDRTGVNLAWLANPPNHNVQLLRQAGAGRLTYGDTLAIGVKDGSNYEYLFYDEQNFGINVSSRKNVPQYNWSLAGKTAGTLVQSGDRVRILNKTNNKFMVYCKRPVGINLAWRETCRHLPTGRLYVP